MKRHARGRRHSLLNILFAYAGYKTGLRGESKAKSLTYHFLQAQYMSTTSVNILGEYKRVEVQRTRVSELIAFSRVQMMGVTLIGAYNNRLQTAVHISVTVYASMLKSR